MGGSRYSDEDYAARASWRSFTGTPVFKYDADIKSGKVAHKVHDSLDPHGVTMRESRDSGDNEKIPIIVTLDVTGSMQKVPAIIQGRLPRLMGSFLEDKASGKRYLGERGYPDILISAVDDYDAMGGKGCLQVANFESGMEIDQALENLWLTDRGGGTYEESYDLALYFAARHTVHDHMEKRGRKGYVFIIGDEHCYPHVSKKQVKEIIGDSLQDDIPLKQIVEEAKRKYHVFFVIPNLTQHYGDDELEKYWVGLLGQQNVLKLREPERICECIAGAVAISESHIGIDDLSSDLGFDTTALVPLSKGALSQHSAEGLPAVAGSVGGVDRL